MQSQPESIHTVPAKVLGCHRPSCLTVLVYPGHGMADGGIPTEIPMDNVPFDLRIPNSEFTLIIDPIDGQFIDLERPTESPP